MPPQILAVQLKQVKCAMHSTLDGAMAADQFKDGNAVLVANDCLAVDQAGSHWQRFDRHLDEGKSMREVVSVARNQLHPGRTPPRQDAKAVMLDFVNPA